MQRHVYDSLIVARKARNYMSAAKCGNIIERKFALAGDLLERPRRRHCGPQFEARLRPGCG